MDIINTYQWIFGQAKSKEVKEIIVVRSNLFSHPTILTGDLHTYGLQVFQTLHSYIDLNKFIVLSVGDMAGNGNKGADVDPTELYTFINEHSKKFYYVQGNHDLQSPTTSDHNIVDGTVVNTEIGKIGGVNGIISDKKRLYRLPEKEFLQHIQSSLNQNINILLTHETPALPVFDPKYKTPCIGQKSLYSSLKSPLIYVYGHCHHTVFYHYISGIHFINADARVIIVIPDNYNGPELFQLEITDFYI